jgi:small-conductance mechanosensitive channel
MTEVLAFLDAHPWTGTLAAALAAVVAAITVHRIGRTVLRRLARHAPLVQALLAHVDRPASAVLPLAALLLVVELAPASLPHLPRVEHFLLLSLIGALTWLVMAAIAGFGQAMIDRNPATMADNLQARRVQTQTRVLARTAMVIVLLAGLSLALMTFPGARQVGASLLASAGVLGIVGGIAARPVFTNLIAGLQIALAQPLRLDDALLVQGEFGRVEEITGTYVVLKLWDERRMVVPLQWFIENPFQNWTRRTSDLHQAVFLHVDFATPLEPLRAELKRLVEGTSDWDGRTATLVATDATAETMKLRALVSARSAGQAFDLGCKVREGLYAFLAREYPHCLPRRPAMLESRQAIHYIPG